MEERPTVVEVKDGSASMSWKDRARRLREDVYALLLALRDPRTPWHAKAVAALVVAYAASPIDLIPDFIPVLGWLDDLVLVPLGVALVIRLVPRKVMDECRARAVARGPLPGGRVVATAIVLTWIALAILFAAMWLHRRA